MLTKVHNIRRALSGRKELVDYGDLSFIDRCIIKYTRITDAYGDSPGEHDQLVIHPGRKLCISGGEVKQARMTNAPKTDDGTLYAWVLPFTTVAMLRNIISSLAVVYKQAVGLSVERGLEVIDVPSGGIGMCDGVYKNLTLGNVGMLLRFGTADPSDTYMPIVEAPASGESKWAIKLIMDAIVMACRRYLNRDVFIKWLFSDSLPAQTQAIKEFLGDPENEDPVFRDTGARTELGSKCDPNDSNARDNSSNSNKSCPRRSLTVAIDVFSLKYYAKALEENWTWFRLIDLEHLIAADCDVYQAHREPEYKATLRRFYDTHYLEQIPSNSSRGVAKREASQICTLECREQDGKITHARVTDGRTRLEHAIDQNAMFCTAVVEVRRVYKRGMRPVTSLPVWKCVEANALRDGHATMQWDRDLVGIATNIPRETTNRKNRVQLEVDNVANDDVETLQKNTDLQFQEQPRNEIRSSLLPSIPNPLTRPGHTMFTDTLSLEIQRAITCRFCGRCSKTKIKENAMFVQLGDTSNTSTPIPLQSLIDTHLQRETIEFDTTSDEFKCPYNCPESQRDRVQTCRGYRDVRLLHVPEVVVITVQRFRKDPEPEQTGWTRIDTPIAFHEYQSVYWGSADFGVKPSSVAVQLVAVICHHGSREDGHYTVLFKTGGMWYLGDDEQVNIVPTDHVFDRWTKDVYMFIVRRVDVQTSAQIHTYGKLARQRALTDYPMHAPSMVGTFLHSGFTYGKRPPTRALKDTPVYAPSSVGTFHPSGFTNGENKEYLVCYANALVMGLRAVFRTVKGLWHALQCSHEHRDSFSVLSDLISGRKSDVRELVAAVHLSYQNFPPFTQCDSSEFLVFLAMDIEAVWGVDMHILPDFGHLSTCDLPDNEDACPVPEDVYSWRDHKCLLSDEDAPHEALHKASHLELPGLQTVTTTVPDYSLLLPGHDLSYVYMASPSACPMPRGPRLQQWLNEQEHLKHRGARGTRVGATAEEKEEPGDNTGARDGTGDSSRLLFSTQASTCSLPAQAAFELPADFLRRKWYFGGCYQHFIRIEPARKRMTHRVSTEEFLKTMAYVGRVCLFPPSLFGRDGYYESALDAILKHLKKKKIRTSLLNNIRSSLIDPGKGGLMCGLFAIGVIRGIDCLERDNKDIHKFLRKAVKILRNQQHASLKTDPPPILSMFIDVMYNTIIPQWSKTKTKFPFEGPTLSPEGFRAEKEFALEASHLIVQMSDEVYACKPKVAVGSKKIINQAFDKQEVYDCVELWNRGPPFTTEEVFTMTNIRIFTVTTCWPCADYNTKAICFHITGLRRRLGKTKSAFADGKNFVPKKLGRKRDRHRRRARFKNFFSDNRLAQPVQEIITIKGGFQCCFCNTKKRFKSKTGVRVHMRRKHGVTGEVEDSPTNTH